MMKIEKIDNKNAHTFILQNAAILFDDGRTLTSHQYCIDFALNHQTGTYDLILGVCFNSNAESRPEEYERLIIPIGMLKNGIIITIIKICFN